MTTTQIAFVQLIFTKVTIKDASVKYRERKVSGNEFYKKMGENNKIQKIKEHRNKKEISRTLINELVYFLQMSYLHSRSQQYYLYTL
jgi:hypothetical protein